MRHHPYLTLALFVFIALPLAAKSHAAAAGKPAPTAPASPAASALASPALDAGTLGLIREQADRANDRLEKLRQAYAAGAVSRKELDQAEQDAQQAERRLREANEAGKPLTVENMHQRVEDSRQDFERASARAKQLAQFYQAGVVSRNEMQTAQEAADQAEVLLHLNEALAKQVEQIAAMPKTPPNRGLPAEFHGLWGHSRSSGFTITAFYRLQDDFYRHFHHVIPVSAFGETETHEKLGFDHEGRVDIALHPDSDEGKWLIEQLQTRDIPFIAFRHAVPGKATGAHIHMGFPSPVIGRLARGHSTVAAD